MHHEASWLIRFRIAPGYCSCCGGSGWLLPSSLTLARTRLFQNHLDASVGWFDGQNLPRTVLLCCSNLADTATVSFYLFFLLILFSFMYSAYTFFLPIVASYFTSVLFITCSGCVAVLLSLDFLIFFLTNLFLMFLFNMLPSDPAGYWIIYSSYSSCPRFWWKYCFSFIQLYLFYLSFYFYWSNLFTSYAPSSRSKPVVRTPTRGPYPVHTLLLFT